MSRAGLGKVYVVEGTMNSQQYVHVLKTRLKRQANDWFDGEWILQQDNAPCHTSKASKQCMREEGIQVLDWPSSSPDMNPIETLWAVIKQKLRQTTLTSKTALINAVLNICMRDTEMREKINETCRKLVDAMPLRVEALLQAKGGHTKY